MTSSNVRERVQKRGGITERRIALMPEFGSTLFATMSRSAHVFPRSTPVKPTSSIANKLKTSPSQVDWCREFMIAVFYCNLSRDTLTSVLMILVEPSLHHKLKSAIQFEFSLNLNLIGLFLHSVYMGGAKLLSLIQKLTGILQSCNLCSGQCKFFFFLSCT